jgi:WD40 repeat protein
VICLALHPDGNRVVSGGEDGTVRVWDLSSHRELYKFTGKGGSVHAVAVSPDRRWLAAGDASGGLRLWNLDNRQERAFAAHQSGIRSVAFSPDARHLLSCDAGGVIVQRDFRTGERDFERRHSQEQERVVALRGRARGEELMRGVLATYCPDGQTIVSAGMDQWVMFWDIATSRLREEVRAGTNIYGLSIRPDGRKLAVAEQLPGI